MHITSTLLRASVAGAVACCLAPALAQADAVSMASSGQSGPSYIAGGEASALTITVANGRYVFTNPAAPSLTVHAPCHRDASHVASCPVTTETGGDTQWVTVRLGSAADHATSDVPATLGGQRLGVSISGGAGNDVLSAQSGASQLYGDDGDDRLSSGPGNGAAQRDIISGGGGNDTLDTATNSPDADTVWCGLAFGPDGSADSALIGLNDQTALPSWGAVIANGGCETITYG